MADKERILFRMVISHGDSGEKTEYTILDKDPIFSSLSTSEKRLFISAQQQKIKRLITRKYHPRYR